jgi:hypothetical protein
MLFSAYGFESAAAIDRPVRDESLFLNANPALRTGLLSSSPCGTVKALRNLSIAPERTRLQSPTRPAGTIETFRLLISRMRLQEYKHFAPGYFHLVPTERLLLHSSYRLSWIECDASDRPFAICYLLFPSAISFLVTVPSIQPWGASVGRKSVF